MKLLLEQIWVLAKSDFKLRFHSSKLGILWAPIRPIVHFIVLDFVFQNLFNRDPLYSLKLMTGIFIFNYFIEGTNAGINSLLGKKNILVNKSNQLWIFVLSSMAYTVLFLFVYIIVIFGFYLYEGLYPSFESIVYFFFLIFSLTIFLIAFSFFTSVLNVAFRDLGELWKVLTTVLFWATPIIYPIDIIPKNLQYILYINPLTIIIINLKATLIDGAIPNWNEGFLIFGIFIVLLTLSYYFFKNYVKSVIEKL